MAASKSVCPRFPYEALNSNAKEIRLFVLLPGTAGKPILSQLRLASFGGGPSISIGSYEALSYTWGSPDVTYRILVNGIPFHIRQNLYWALLKLRLPHTERVLWIDAICINQNDVNERNHQVQQMADIYRRASGVIVWLGPSTPSSRKAAIFIRQLRSISLGNFALYEAQWPGVRDLCSRPYWKRIWIVQEVGVARNIKILCGEDQLSWNDFSQLLLKISTSKAIAVPEAVQSIKSSLASRLQTQRAAYQSHGCTLWRLLRDFADSSCAVPHDKVYGLLGLASGRMSELIVDYSKSLTELQRDLVALYNEDLRGGASNTAEDTPKMPNIVSFASFLSRSLGIYTEDMTTFDFNPVFLPPAQTLLQVEATLVGVITALHSKESYAPLSSDLPFKGSWKEPGLQDDAYLGKFLLEEERSRYLVRGFVAAQRGLPLRHNEEPYIQGHERHSRHPASKTVSRDTQTQFHILHEVRWFSATNNVRGFGPDGIQVGDLVYSLQERRQKLVVRPRENGYSIVGTAHVGKWAADETITNAGKVLISPPIYMTFYLEIMTLQLFTLLRSVV